MKLRERDHELSSIITHTPDIIYRLDSEGRIVFISGAVERYGYAVAELIGRDIIDLVHPEDREKAKWRVRERRRGPRSTESFSVRLLTKDFESVCFENRCDRMRRDRVFSLVAEVRRVNREISVPDPVRASAKRRPIVTALRGF